MDIEFIGINYPSTRVFVLVTYQPSGQTRDFTFEGPTLLALRQAVPNFAGLRVTLLAYLQTLDTSLGGSVT